MFFSRNDRKRPKKRLKTTENDRKNGSFGCAAKNEFFDFSTKFHSNSSIFRENSVYLHRFNEIIYIKVWKEKNYFTIF